MASEMPLAESLALGLKACKVLRSSVGQVFQFITDGIKDNSAEDKDKQFVLELQQLLQSVGLHMRDLEAVCTALPSAGLHLGNCGQLSQDPVHDKSPMHLQLIQSYKWTDKVHEFAAHASMYLGQNSLKRSNINPGLLNKRSRKTPPTSHNVLTHVVDSVVANLDRLFPDMSVTLSRPQGSSAILQITLGKTLKALIVLRSLIIEWAVVKAYNEELGDEDGKPRISLKPLQDLICGTLLFTPPAYLPGHFAMLHWGTRGPLRSVRPELDLWASSKYTIFQKVTEHANAAMLHFYSPLIPELAVRSFMTWLHSYNNLFTAPCHRCGRHLQDNIPPTWRDVRNLDAYHESCRP